MFDLRQAAAQGVLIAAHRGSWMGNIPCNTLMAFEAALLQGADIIELDVSRSLDGTLYVFHPGLEPHFLGSEKRISEMHDDEVRLQRLRNAEGTPTVWPVPLLDDALDYLKGRCMINVDKFTAYPEDIIRAVRRHDMVEQVLVKTFQKEESYRLMEELAPDFPYMTFCVNEDHDSEMLVKRNLRYLGTEALFNTEDSEFCTAAYHEKMHRMGLLTWANAIVFNYKTVHAAGHSDDVSAIGRPDEGWGYLSDLGFNMIQTDWIASCVHYFAQRGLHRDI